MAENPTYKKTKKFQRWKGHFRHQNPNRTSSSSSFLLVTSRKMDIIFCFDRMTVTAQQILEIMWAQKQHKGQQTRHKFCLVRVYLPLKWQLGANIRMRRVFSGLWLIGSHGCHVAYNPCMSTLSFWSQSQLKNF